MARKIINCLATFGLLLSSSALFADSTAFSSFTNYYKGNGLRSSGTQYGQVSLPVFSFDDADLASGHIGTLKTFCFAETAKCVVVAAAGGWSTLFVADDASVINASINHLPIMPNLVLARVDADTLQRMQIRSETTYEWGVNNEIDGKVFECGLGVAGCGLAIGSAATGLGAIGALLTCTATAKLCTDAAKAMNKYEEQLREAAAEKAAAERAATPNGGGGGAGGAVKGKTDLLETQTRVIRPGKSHYR